MSHNGSYIWDVDIEVKWSYNIESDDFESINYMVASPTFEKACSKALAIASKDSTNKKWTETLDDGKEVVHEVVRYEIIKVKRGDWIDG